MRDTKRQDAGSESQKSRPATAPFLRLNSSKDSVRAPREKEKRILRTGSAKNVASGPLGWSSTGRLKDTFFQFTNGEMEMNMSMFLKFCRDCKVLNRKSCTSHDVDVIFAMIRGTDSRKISYQQFLDGIWHCSQKRGEHLESLERTIMESGGLKVTGTVPVANRLHDDSLSTSGHSQASTFDMSSDEMSFSSSRSICRARELCDAKP